MQNCKCNHYKVRRAYKALSLKKTAVLFTISEINFSRKLDFVTEKRIPAAFITI